MPNILANVELSTSQSAPVAWADVLGLSAVVTVQNTGSIILLLATIPLKSSSSIETAEFRFAVGGVREGPFCQGQHQATSAIGSADIATFAYALTGLVGSQTFSIQWQEVLNTLTLNTAKVRNFQVLEILAGDRLRILGTAYDRTSGIESAVGYVDVDDLDLTVPVEDTDSVIVLAGTLPIGQGTGSDRVASCRLADGGVGEGGEAIIYSDTTNEGTGLSTLMRVKDAISGMHTFSLQWKTELANLAGQISLFRERSLQALEFRSFTFSATIVALTGTATGTIEENDILDGGKTIILTLTDDTWVAAGAAFDAIRQDIIDGMVSSTISGTGFRFWNDEVTPNEVVGAVVRTSDTVVTITLTASPLYNIFSVDPAIIQETITVTVPASALVTSTISIAASPDFTVDQSPVDVIITGTLDGSDESDVVAGGRTMLLTIRQASWTSMWGATQAQLIIDGLNSAQSELTGWNNEVRDKMPVTDVVRTGNQLLTITLSAQAGYNITAPEVITATIPDIVITGGPGADFDATPDINIAIEPVSAALSGTITPASTEAQMVAGGRTLLITLDSDTWVASGAAFNGVRQAIIDGITSAQSEVTGWNNEIRDNLPVGQVVRTSDTVVTVSFTPETGYNITDFEEITVTVPAAAMVIEVSPVVATPTFFIFEVPIAIVTGTVTPDAEVAEIVAGGETIILTLIDDEWVAAGATFNAVRQDIIDGLDSAGVEATGWNAEVRDNLPVTAVVRTSATVVTITLTAQAGFAITATETITVTVPGSALDQTPNPITGVPTFDVKALPGSKARDRRGGKHAEDIFDVNTPNVETFPVNKFD